MASAPDAILELVERFERGRKTYMSHAYNETQVRREFIDPMFSALGWDVANSAGYADTYKDVVHEDRLTIDGVSKAPDYSFRIGGVRKFFVEAKKPSVNLQTNPAPAYQLRRYAWNAKLPVSVLTDFEEFVVYDCRHPPATADLASEHRLAYLKSWEYPERWEEIASIFSKEAILLGAFDQFTASTKAKRGTSEVDRSFLAEMEDWRRELAEDLVRNNSLTPFELNFSVQQIIDRIVFLRICEDRGIEPYGELRNAANVKSGAVYSELLRQFRRADDRYNSGLFHFQEETGRAEPPDTLTPTLKVSGSALKRIIRRLYYPESPYNFRVLPADILGSVYERFLGQVIVLTGDGGAVVEPKPEVRKAGGVYYTPTYIVQRMVDATLGPLLEQHNPVSVAKVRILDPASGSGSFLLAAYDYLLKWYLDKYQNSKSTTYRSRIYEGDGGRFHLTVEEKRRILLTHIYGVDLDTQAVEVTKLSLLLRVLEDENAQTLADQLKLFHERALPNLSNNIKCGNSLIRPDFFNNVLLATPSERSRVKAFDWDAEFPEVMAEGGFDVVIGNPPYIFTREQFTPEERRYYADKYPSGWEKRNTFMLFMELMVRLLLKPTGKGAYIVPNSWLTVESSGPLRELLKDRLRKVEDLNYGVFEDAAVEPCIFVVEGAPIPHEPVDVMRVHNAHDLSTAKPISMDRSTWDSRGGTFSIPDEEGQNEVADLIFAKSVPIGDRFEVLTGLQAYEAGKGTPKQTRDDVIRHVFDREQWEDNNSYRYLRGHDVHRFGLEWSGMWMQYGPWLSQPREIGMFTRPAC